MNVTIYHNPNCSNSRGCLALLKEREAAGAVALTVIEYLTTPPTRAELVRLAAGLKASAGARWPGLREGMMRAKEKLYAELGLDGASDDALLDAIAAHPVLLNRPIVAGPRGTKLCRPPETVAEVL
jgi:arsenate reductase (glutaredoxin)